MTESQPTILDNIRDEAASIGAGAAASDLAARLLGGVAVWLRCPSVRQGPFARSYADMDFAVAKTASQPFKAQLESRGYLPDKFFNGLHGATRLYYQAPDGKWSVDIVIDELTMSHKLDLRGRLAGPSVTVSLADLLLTKLQVWEITRKDLGDIVCLLADHGLGAGGTAGGADGADGAAGDDDIDLDRVTSALAGDWGFCHTVERNLGRVAELWSAEGPLPGAAFDVGAQVDALRAAIAATPKSRAWRMRARVGERVRWYETPEEVRH
jgi:hypothetical protein